MIEDKVRKGLDFSPLIAFVLSNEVFHKDINRIYKTNELLFNIESKKNKYYNCFSSGSAIKQLYYHRALGIISSGKVPKKEVYNILKKVYKYEDTYCNNLKTFKMIDYTSKLLRKNKGFLTVNDFNCHSIVAVAMCIINNIKIDENDDHFKHFMLGMINILDFEKDDKYKINYAKADQEDKNIVFKQLKRLQKENPYLLKEGTLKENKDFDANKNAIELLFDIFNISLLDLTNDIELTDNEILSILYCYLVAHDGIIDDTNDLDDWLNYSIKIAYILKAYNETKCYILNNNNEELLLKIQNLNNENNKLKNDLILANNEIEKLKKENSSILNENNKLKLEIEKLNKDKKEINSLREYIFNNSNSDEEVINTAFNLDETINKLNKLDVIIIGGKSGWINKIKEILPSWSYIPTDSINFDVRLLNNKYVLFNTDYVSHSMYYKVIENISKAKQLNFFSGSTNINLSLKKIYEIYCK